MKFPFWLQVYGNQEYRGDCPSENSEAITFFAKIRREYPTSYGLIATHIRNEGARSHGQATRQKSEGMVKGAPDIIIPANPPFLCELKRRDHTKSRFQVGQLDYLKVAQENGAFACVALGYEAAYEAFLTCYKQKN